ncbi:ATP-binding protein [bacterium]|nr:ATP-binding protein [bacterium]
MFKELILEINQFESSFDFLLSKPDHGKLSLRYDSEEEFMTCVKSLIKSIKDEISNVDSEHLAERLIFRLGENPDSIDYFNNIIRLTQEISFADLLKKRLCFDLSLIIDLNNIQANCKIKINQILMHSARLIKLACLIPEKYFSKLKKMLRKNDQLLRLVYFDPFETGNEIFSELEDLIFHVRELDGFSNDRAFTFDSEINFSSFSVDHIRDRIDFYGYRETKLFFMDHFSEFANNNPVLPLFIYGPPGLGKTHFTISMALAYQNLNVICMGKEQFETRLGKLFARLKNYSYRRFVVFIDDIDPKTIDWYQFRSYVDGMMHIPENVSLVISTNFEFSSRILSRGKVLEFQRLNARLAEEMINDYFVSTTGHNLPDALFTIIAADYVNEQINGPLHELTPRSLLVYLQTLEKNSKRWNSLVYEAGCENVFRVATDGEFVRSNKNVMKKLY